MNLKYFLKKNIGIKDGYLIAILLVLMIGIGGYFSYAVFTASSEGKGALNMVAGDLYSYIRSDDLNEEKQITVGAGEAVWLSLDLVNLNSIDAKFNLYYSLSEESDKLDVKYLKSGDEAPTDKGYNLSKSVGEGHSKTIKIRIVNNEKKPITITFGSDVGLPTAELAFPSDKQVINKLTTNENLIVAYTYNQERDAAGNNSENFCVTGEEDGCQISNCYQNDNCPLGTIVKYRVNDNDFRYFHVMKDKGEELTMQQRENTLYYIPWNDSGNIRVGPLSSLIQLENETGSWKYVNNQNYTPGETVFGQDNAFNGCKIIDSSDNSSTIVSCTENVYDPTTIERVNVKARMITVQEANEFGCPWGSSSQSNRCPIWMINYLDMAKVYGGGTVNDYHPYTLPSGYTVSNQGYMTMNVNPERESYWYIRYSGVVMDIYFDNVGSSHLNFSGMRAVINVNKK